MMWHLINAALVICSLGFLILVMWRYPENSLLVFLSHVFGGVVVGWLLREMVLEITWPVR